MGQRVNDNERSNAKKRAQRQLVLRSDGPTEGIRAAEAAAMGALREAAVPTNKKEARNRAEADYAAKQGAEQNREEGATDPKERAHHGHHFHVTHAHAFALPYYLVERGSSPENQAAEGGPEQGVQNSREHRMGGVAVQPDVRETAWRDSCGKSQRDAESEPVHCIGQQAHPKIGDDKDDDETTEEKKLERGQSNAKRVVGKNKQHAGEKFDDRVHRRNRQMAMAAFATKQEPPKNRDIVVRFDGRFATRATRARRNNGNSLGNARDANV